MRSRLERDYGLSSYDAETLTADREIADYFVAVVSNLPSDPKLCANWVMGETSAYLNDEGKSFDQLPAVSAGACPASDTHQGWNHLRKDGEGSIQADVDQAQGAGNGLEEPAGKNGSRALSIRLSNRRD